MRTRSRPASQWLARYLMARARPLARLPPLASPLAGASSVSLFLPPSSLPPSISPSPFPAQPHVTRRPDGDIMAERRRHRKRIQVPGWLISSLFSQPPAGLASLFLLAHPLPRPVTLPSPSPPEAAASQHLSCRFCDSSVPRRSPPRRAGRIRRLLPLEGRSWPLQFPLLWAERLRRHPKPRGAPPPQSPSLAARPLGTSLRPPISTPLPRLSSLPPSRWPHDQLPMLSTQNPFPALLLWLSGKKTPKKPFI